MKEGDIICCTTNGNTIKKSGFAVMGAGIAKAFRDKFTGIDKTLGQYLIKYGNRCFILGKTNNITIASFPTKDNWQEDSKLTLIEQSAKQLREMADKFNWTRILLPAPGCSNGNLQWKDVRPILEKHFDDRFNILFLNKEDIKTGKLKLASVNSLKTMTDLDEYKIKLLIVRSSEKAQWAINKFNLVHAPALSPSQSLFYWYLDNRDNPNWFDTYTPIFKEEMKEQSFQIAYDRIKNHLDNGDNVILICFCKDYKLCHRSIIGESLKNEEYEVIFE